MSKDVAEKSEKAEKGEKGAKAGKEGKAPGLDFSYTQNRELSWLRFDDRILDEAYDETVPVFERLKFCEIVDAATKG